MITIKL